MFKDDQKLIQSNDGDRYPGFNVARSAAKEFSFKNA